MFFLFFFFFPDRNALMINAEAAARVTEMPAKKRCENTIPLLLIRSALGDERHVEQKSTHVRGGPSLYEI